MSSRASWPLTAMQRWRTGARRNVSDVATAPSSMPWTATCQGDGGARLTAPEGLFPPYLRLHAVAGGGVTPYIVSVGLVTLRT